ncbi:MAG TPA: M28 family peptidase [Kofleriaceae bacterium]|nr:M28 family peptidase [Kofleriaceae bacterium]
MRAVLALFALLAACGTSAPPLESPGGPGGEPGKDKEGQAAAPAAPAAAASAPASAPTPIADQYREVAAKIIAAAEADEGAWQKLSYLTDHIGNRISGSRSLDKAIEWAAATMKADGHEEVRTEKVMVTHWVRGEESAALVAPVERPIALIGLGGSGSTPGKGVVADVVVVKDFDELDRLGSQGQVKGKIVLFDTPMGPYSPEKGPGYGQAVEFRTRGPARAAALGARAALVRSLTSHSLRTPHTGATRFEDQKPIPCASVTVEDSELIARLAASGERVRVKLLMKSRMLPDAPSANVLAELRGREKPDEIVLIGGHIDSWDVGQGAHDDGVGIVMSMQALTLLRKLGLHPRRTIRAVLFTNEENGLGGARQYAADHAAELSKHVMALEADSGAFQPRGFDVQAGAPTVRQLTDAASLLRPIDGQRIEASGHAGSDIGPLAAAGVPLLGLMMDDRHYFDYHHTEADTLDKVDPHDLARDVAAVAVLAYVVADMPERLVASPPEAEVPRR